MEEPILPLPLAAGMLVAVFVATLVGVLFLPAAIISMANSLIGPQAKAFWDLSRAAGIVAYLLLWASTAFGLLVTSKLARLWPGGPTAVDLHEFTSLLALAFAVFHVVILLGDPFIKYTLPQLLIPFASTNYQQFWVAVGQLAAYLALPVTFSFYFRKQIGYRTWRVIHYASFILYLMVTIHGIFAGSDTTRPLVLGLYGLSGLTVYFLFLYRLFVSIRRPRTAT